MTYPDLRTKPLLERVANAVGNVTAIVVCGAIIGFVLLMASRHVTCVDFLQKFCVIH